MKSLSFGQATFGWLLFMPWSAALSFASNPFFCVPVKLEALIAA
jgi:hypothetical protein